MSGKGDTPRPVDPKKYGENYDRIFRNGQDFFEPSEIKELLKRHVQKQSDRRYTTLDAVARQGCHAAVARPMNP